MVTRVHKRFEVPAATTEFDRCSAPNYISFVFSREHKSSLGLVRYVFGNPLADVQPQNDEHVVKTIEPPSARLRLQTGSTTFDTSDLILPCSLMRSIHHGRLVIWET